MFVPGGFGYPNRRQFRVRLIDPRDVAPMVVFLASDEARMASCGTYSIAAGYSANILS
ncbi:hypothetical protein GB927_024965 [Shinella sp. CPCC 100929]|uniref:Uncharacterized protein n=2 Tax=Shinella lacus TaxID=2654216 RepID=A0ABT1RDS6_9HYPH|nr:hypothetical protein [Shinella lacus]